MYSTKSQQSDASLSYCEDTDSETSIDLNDQKQGRETIPLFKVFMSKHVTDNLIPVLTSGYITQGEKVEEYEETIREWFEHPYILSVNSATSGLTLALHLLNLSDGDQVLCTPLTCLATNLPVLYNRLRIKWVDVDPYTCNMDLNDLERKITDTTKAILFVHWGGYPIDIRRINAIRDRYNIPIIEDCAHAFGAMYDNKFVGTHGNISVFSTQAIKHLTTGDGGLLFLPDQDIFNRAKLLRWYGISRETSKEMSSIDFRMESDVKEWGYKFHMNDINATIGLANLPFIKGNLDRTRSIADRYHVAISSMRYIREAQSFTTDSSYWLYTIHVPDKIAFMKYMRENGIMTSQVHKRNDTHTCLRLFQSSCPQVSNLEETMVCIPIGWWLSDDDVEHIIQCLQDWDNGFFIHPIQMENRISYLQLWSQLSGIPGIMSEKDFSDTLARIRNQCAEIYVKTYCRTVIATAKLLIETKIWAPVAHIEDVIVHKDWRGLGYGTEMIHKLIEKAKAHDCYKVILHAKPELTPFYTQCGFIKEGNLFTYRMEFDI